MVTDAQKAILSKSFAGRVPLTADEEKILREFRESHPRPANPLFTGQTGQYDNVQITEKP